MWRHFSTNTTEKTVFDQFRQVRQEFEKNYETVQKLQMEFLDVFMSCWCFIELHLKIYSYLN